MTQTTIESTDMDLDIREFSSPSPMSPFNSSDEIPIISMEELESPSSSPPAPVTPDRPPLITDTGELGTPRSILILPLPRRLSTSVSRRPIITCWNSDEEDEDDAVSRARRIGRLEQRASTLPGYRTARVVGRDIPGAKSSNANTHGSVSNGNQTPTASFVSNQKKATASASSDVRNKRRKIREPGSSQNTIDGATEALRGRQTQLQGGESRYVPYNTMGGNTYTTPPARPALTQFTGFSGNRNINPTTPGQRSSLLPGELSIEGDVTIGGCIGMTLTRLSLVQLGGSMGGNINTIPMRPSPMQLGGSLGGNVDTMPTRQRQSPTQLDESTRENVNITPTKSNITLNATARAITNNITPTKQTPCRKIHPFTRNALILKIFKEQDDAVGTIAVPSRYIHHGLPWWGPVNVDKNTLPLLMNFLKPGSWPMRAPSGVNSGTTVQNATPAAQPLQNQAVPRPQHPPTLKTSQMFHAKQIPLQIPNMQTTSQPQQQQLSPTTQTPPLSRATLPSQAPRQTSQMLPPPLPNHPQNPQPPTEVHMPLYHNYRRYPISDPQPLPPLYPPYLGSAEHGTCLDYRKNWRKNPQPDPRISGSRYVGRVDWAKVPSMHEPIPAEAWI